MTPPPEMAERARAVLAETLLGREDNWNAKFVLQGHGRNIWSDEALTAMLTFATREVERERAAILRHLHFWHDSGDYDLTALIGQIEDNEHNPGSPK